MHSSLTSRRGGPRRCVTDVSTDVSQRWSVSQHRSGLIRVSCFGTSDSCVLFPGVVHCPFSCTCMYVMHLLEPFVVAFAVSRLLNHYSAQHAQRAHRAPKPSQTARSVVRWFVGSSRYMRTYKPQGRLWVSSMKHRPVSRPVSSRHNLILVLIHRAVLYLVGITFRCLVLSSDEPFSL